VNGPLLGTAWYRMSTTFGRRWTGYLTIVLLIGLIGGLAMGSVAGARRTRSSFATYLAGRLAARTPTALLLHAE
jgi:hypothetical protein